ncbi:hypothetical protein EON65_46920 [archaeon]|nr:MAG: hypothetical protein EON65_46920 [archaeon]
MVGVPKNLAPRSEDAQHTQATTCPARGGAGKASTNKKQDKSFRLSLPTVASVSLFASQWSE